MEQTPNLALPYLAAQQAQKHVTHNEALRMLDAIIQLSVIDRTRTSPPATPQEGDRHLVAANAEGVWTGHDGAIAAFQDGGWAFYSAQDGWIAYVAAEQTLIVWSGTQWTSLSGASASLNPAVLVGVNTVADATNRLSVSADATLLTAETSDHRLKINKLAANDTASVLFQTGFGGRAEFGLAGDDDFHVKVSPDGTAWHEAIVINRASGAVSLPNTPGNTFTPFAARAKAVFTDTLSVVSAVATPISWTVEDYDTAGFFNLAQADRMTIPAGISAVLVYGYVQMQGTLGTSNYMVLRHFTSDGNQASGPYLFALGGGSFGEVASGPIAVSQGDYFELHVFHNAGAPRLVMANGRTYFAIAAIA